jgi:uncharacterized small protein (DUF1192 family)
MVMAWAAPYLQQTLSCGSMHTTAGATMDTDDLPKPKHIHLIGENLEAISVDELHARVGALKAEIARLETEIARKKSSRSAADAFFKS